MMNRRDLFKAAGVAGVGAGLAAAFYAADIPEPGGKAVVKAELKRLMLRHTWTTTMSSSAYRDTVHVQYQRDGITGYGEGAPIVRYLEYPEQAKQAIDAIIDKIAVGDPRKFDKFLAEVRRLLGDHQHAAMAAVDIAVCDWLGKKLGIPLYEYFGLDPADAPMTTFSIGIDTPELPGRKSWEAPGNRLPKGRVRLSTDEPTIEAVRSVTKKPLRVDANEGWTDKEEAVRKINWLEKQGVEFIEQPMPAPMSEETRWVRSRVHRPIIADEACERPTDIAKLRDAYDGINVKLDKCGGVLEAFRMSQVAKVLGMRPV